jgi:hypothetical protein
VVKGTTTQCSTRKENSSHLGVESTRRRARECMFWPGMNNDIKLFIEKCDTCRTLECSQRKEPLMHSEPAIRPWQKICCDLFTLNNREYLLTIDYYSNCIEVDRLYKTTSSEVIHKLKAHCARHGIPDAIISDNGPQFTSKEFAEFMEKWSIEHYTSSPYHQQGNGKAEAGVKIAKNLMKKALKDNKDPYLALLDYRNTPNQTTGISPAQALFNRRAKTLLPSTQNLLKPNVPNPNTVKQIEKRMKAKTLYDKNTKTLPVLNEGDVVRMKPFSLTDKTWKKAVVQQRLDERSYVVQNEQGSYRRNRVDIKKTNEDFTMPQNQTFPIKQANILPHPMATKMDEKHENIKECQRVQKTQQTDENSNKTSSMNNASQPPTLRDRSHRKRCPPKYLNDYDVKAK